MACREELKKRRSSAQAVFTRKANSIVFNIDLLTEHDLMSECRTLKDSYNEVCDSSFDYIAAMEEEDASGFAAEIAEVEKKLQDCRSKYQTTEMKLKEASWSRCASGQFDSLRVDLKDAISQVESLKTGQTKQDQFDSMLTAVEGREEALSEFVFKWDRYVPEKEVNVMRACLKELKERRRVAMVVLATALDGRKRSGCGDLRSRTSSEGEGSDEGGADGGVTTSTSKPGGPAATGGEDGPARGDGALDADMNPAAYQSAAVDSNSQIVDAGGSDGARAASPSTVTLQAPPQGPLSQRLVSPVFNPGLSSTPQQLRGIHGVRPNGAGAGQSTSTVSQGSLGTRIALAPLSLPKFFGDRRSYWRWKSNWGTLQALAEPTGSPECRLFHLMDSIADPVKCELRLSHCRTASEVFRVLEDCYGDVSQIADDIVLELQELPGVRNNKPREVLQLIQAVERALLDLIDLGCEDAIKNQLVIRSLESKLPDSMKERWLLYRCDPVNDVSPQNRFDKLWQFLKDQKTVLVQLEQLQSVRQSNTARAAEPSPREKPKERPDRRVERRSFTKATASETRGELSQNPCCLCGEEGHTGRLYRCKTFKRANPSERRAYVKRTRVCPRCLDSHGSDDPCSKNFLCRNEECRRGDASSDHHFFLCLKTPPRKDAARQGTKGGKRREPHGPTQEQEAVFAGLGLSPEQLEAVRKACTNKVTSKLCAGRGSEDESCLKELPVLMMLLDVTTKRGDWIGALIDLASDTNYITHQAADRLGLTGEPITLVVHGVGGMEAKVETKRYLVSIKVATKKGTWRLHEMVCYGLEEIANVGHVVDSERLERFFPGSVEPGELIRPEKIELLISTREGRLAPQRMMRCGDLVLWDGPLGKTISGAHPDLFEDVEVTARFSSTHFACSMKTESQRVAALRSCYPRPKDSVEVGTTNTSNAEVIKWLQWDSIGAACDPVCGGCRCGKCAPGGKEMSLADERELEIIRGGLTFKLSDNHSDKPHWDAKYPWKEDPVTLPNNRKAVEATFLKSEKRLEKDPLWKAAYAKQVRDMLARGAAIQLSQTVLNEWKGAVWWINHLMAPNPHSNTTPVRLVWDSSQVYRGVSLNSILMKGPDVLNPIRAVLLHFREGEHAAIGDVSKMYNSVWLEDQEVHVHRFLWRNSPEEDIKDYAVVRVNMGDKPAGCIAQVAMRETALLPQFVNRVVERRVIEEDTYVDDILVSHNDPERLSEILEGVETILKYGGFYLKPWVRSGFSGRQGAVPVEPETIMLPNQLRTEDNKALGVGYLVEEDKFFLMVAINFSTRKKKMRTQVDLTEENVGEKTPNPLTRRMLLSQVAGLYDPLGLATPLKQKGVILVRRAFQEAGILTKDTWDKPLSSELRGRAIKLFEEYARLSTITFPRSITPSGWVGKPWGITFSDGSCDSYGAVLYLRWETSEGVRTRLVESMAKLTPVEQKGDAVKAEICGAVFATRLKGYFLKYSRLEIDRWYHFLDSQTVLGAIQRESYGFQTFFANRVGEIQKAGPVTDWWWLPGQFNVADLVTRGCSPEQLSEDSSWQTGPAFLTKPIEEWPIKSAAEVASGTREVVSRLQRKAFSAILTRSQERMQTTPDGFDSVKTVVGAQVNPELLPFCNKVTSFETVGSSPVAPSVCRIKEYWGSALINQVDLSRFNSLAKLCGVIAYVRRALRFWLTGRGQTAAGLKWEAVPTAQERVEAFQDLCLAAQAGVTFPTTTLNRLVVRKDKATGLMMCHGRVQSVEEERSGVPLIPYKCRLSSLLAEDAHRVNHEGVSATLLRMRKRGWVVQGPRIVRKVIDSCISCRKCRARLCTQVMSDLPPVRTTPAAPFEYTTLDLFGPYFVRDSVRRRVKKKVWGVVFSCMASRAVHADVVEDLSTEGFLKAYQRFTALRGHPKKLWSDQGTNFVGAKPALKELYDFLGSIDKEEIQRRAAVVGSDWMWEFSPADSPHRNGAVEAAVRVLKRALSNIGEEGNLTVLEFQTLLYLAANLTNERPIGARAQVQEETVDVVTPNSLLLGRAGPRGDNMGFEFPAYPFSRLRAVQVEVDKFWRRWSQLAGPHLFVRQKWHAPARNVSVGDLVWVADQNALRGRFKLGRVEEADADDRGVVRDVKVRICCSRPINWSQARKDREPCHSTILHRDVRRLVVFLPVEEQEGRGSSP
ncbi:alcohol-forming fatty acyl-CoA reductase [Sarotherodon galilaeus]